MNVIVACPCDEGKRSVHTNNSVLLRRQEVAPHAAQQNEPSFRTLENRSIDWPLTGPMLPGNGLPSQIAYRHRLMATRKLSEKRVDS